MRTSQPPEPISGLPANLDAERFVLGVILLDAERSLTSIRSALDSSDFSLKKHRLIFRRVLEIAERGDIVDRVTVANELQRRDELASCGGLSYFVSLDDGLPHVPSIDAYVRLLREKALRRRIIFKARDFYKRAMQESDDANDIVATGANFFRKLQLKNGHHEQPSSTRAWPDPIRPEGFYGVAGDLVRMIEPLSEADPAALLLQFLIAWGNLGRARPVLSRGRGSPPYEPLHRHRRLSPAREEKAPRGAGSGRCFG